MFSRGAAGLLDSMTALLFWLENGLMANSALGKSQDSEGSHKQSPYLLMSTAGESVQRLGASPWALANCAGGRASFWLKALYLPLEVDPGLHLSPVNTSL